MGRVVTLYARSTIILLVTQINKSVINLLLMNLKLLIVSALTYFTARLVFDSPPPSHRITGRITGLHPRKTGLHTCLLSLSNVMANHRAVFMPYSFFVLSRSELALMWLPCKTYTLRVCAERYRTNPRTDNEVNALWILKLNLFFKCYLHNLSL